jgi:hypothetical protein
MKLTGMQMNNKTKDIFAKVVKVSASARALTAEYRFLQSLSSRYKHFPHHEIIFHAIQCAMDELSSPSPVKAGLLAEAISNHANRYRDIITGITAQLDKACLKLMKEIEPEACRLISQEMFGGRSVDKINFRRIKGDVELLQRHKPGTKLCEVLTEILISNRVIADLHEEIGSVDCKVKAYEKWVATPEYSRFITVYGCIRGHQSKSYKKMGLIHD